VQHGVERATRMLQRALNRVADGRLSVDGRLGPVTLDVLRTARADEVRAEVLAQRMELYGSIIGNDHAQAVFARGWMKRVGELIAWR